MPADDLLTPAPTTSPPPPPPPSTWARLRPLVLRLHFYAGVLVAPFLLVAAVSGTLYAATPQIEEALHRHQLHVTPSATQLPLAEQVRAAVDARGGAAPVAVRPAPTPSDTTRVLFADAALGESERAAVFVDPGTGEVRGQLTVYGTSGALPLRTWVDQLHRDLHLGAPGRLYSELAASWLWVLTLSGLGLWAARRWSRRAAPDGARRAAGGRGGRDRTRTLHAVVGTWIAVGLLALSATGLTWSTYAGARVTDLRGALSWQTPAVNTTLPGTAGGTVAGGHEGHAGHAGHEGHEAAADPAVTPAAFEEVLATARAAGLTAAKIEVRAPAAAGAAWKVDEVDRGLRTRVDSAAIALTTTATGQVLDGQVLDVVRFADHPFPAKLARWGVDLHSGSFGLGNQLVLVALGLGLTAVVLWGYRLWWLRRPDPARRLSAGPPAHRGAWRHLPAPVLAAVVVVTVAVGWALPLLGVSLLAFLAVDVALGAAHRARGRRAPAPTTGDRRSGNPG
ncbi:PepSY-associated TM helix domain-containing protein [Kineococcus sp. SYSU DK002]|uniref:PepSY-associated TM helix domain-containing protein n=1 Tax=Kineococcus sp. SYSU DK002 TaxID=3383123 RepID=UPI003D7DC722